VNDVPSGTSFVFTPTSTGNHSLRVRARIANRLLGWGPAKVVNVSTAASQMSLQFSSTAMVSGNQVQLDFDVTNYRAGAVFQLLKASDPAGSWNPDNSATLQTLVANSRFRFTTPTGGAGQSFYRLSAN
jgi:hypothetical protein